MLLQRRTCPPAQFVYRCTEIVFRRRENAVLNVRFADPRIRRVFKFYFLALANTLIVPSGLFRYRPLGDAGGTSPSSTVTERNRKKTRRTTIPRRWVEKSSYSRRDNVQTRYRRNTW